MGFLIGSITTDLSYFMQYLTPENFLAAGTALLIFIGAYLAFTLLIYVFTHAGRKLTSKTNTTLDDFVFTALQKPLRYFAIVLSAYAALSYALPGHVIFGYPLHHYLIVLLVLLSATLFSGVINSVIKWYGKEIGPKGKKGVEDMFPMVRKLVSIVLYTGAVIIVLEMFNIEVAPLIAGLGIAGLAVALALQDTLANFFAGVYMLADKPIKKDDYIEVGANKGYVQEIGWRATKIKQWDNNLIIIPNAELAKATIINFNQPDGKMSFWVDVGVAYGTDTDKALKALKKATETACKNHPSGLPKENVSVRIASLGDSSIVLRSVFPVKTYSDRFGMAGAIYSQVLKDFRKQKIGIPFPTHTVYLHDEKKKR